jgi:hypothetical protein
MKEIDGAIYFDDFMRYCEINPVFVQVHLRIPICLYLYLNTFIYLFIYKCIHAFIYIYIYICIYMYIYINIQFTHRLQSHIRMCIFGLPYWIKKSRQLKIKSGNIMMSTSSNMESETFISKQLLDPNFRLTKNEKILKIPEIIIDENETAAQVSLLKAKLALNSKYSVQLPGIFQRPISPPKNVNTYICIHIYIYIYIYTYIYTYVYTYI